MPPPIGHGATFQRQTIKTAKQAKSNRTKAADRKRKGQDGLTRRDWESVHGLFEYSGNPRELATRSGLHIDDIKILLDNGIERLGLPGVKEYAIKQAEVELELKARRDQATLSANNNAVREAVTERAITDAAAAQDLLGQAVTTGVILGSFVDQLAKNLASGKSQLAIPEYVDTDVLESLAKVASANAQTMERAVKLSRLTKGQSTDQIDHRIAVLLGECSDEELRVAALGDGLPKRLVSRASAEPINDGAGSIGINSKATVIDAEFSGGEEPDWLKGIAPAEGSSSEDSDASSSE